MAHDLHGGCVACERKARKIARLEQDLDLIRTALHRTGAQRDAAEAKLISEGLRRGQAEMNLNAAQRQIRSLESELQAYKEAVVELNRERDAAVRFANNARGDE